jgi:hypothetical protein
MHNIFEASTNTPKPDDLVRARIRAKLELWEFLSESIEEILATYLDRSELAEEIINTTIWQLHPHFTGPELLREVQQVLVSLKIPLPQPYVQTFRVSFQRIIVKKMLRINENRINKNPGPKFQ